MIEQDQDVRAGADTDIDTDAAESVSGSAADADTAADIDRDAIEETIEMIRPALQMDGGDIALVEISDDGDVEIQLHGACVGCPASLMTLKAGIERIMKDRHPGVREIIATEG